MRNPDQTDLTFEALPIRPDIDPAQLRIAREEVAASLDQADVNANTGLGRGAVSSASTPETPRGYGNMPEVAPTMFEDELRTGANILALRQHAQNGGKAA